MPTEADLRTVLQEFAALADACGGFDAAAHADGISRANLRHTPASNGLLRRRMAIGISAAAISAAIAGVTAAVLAEAGNGHGHRTANVTDRNVTSAPPAVKTSPDSTARVPVPANALRWSFTVDPLPGYAFSYNDYELDPKDAQQNASITSTADPNVNAGITVHPRGGFDPAHGSVDATAVHGQPVTVNGRPGTFVAGPSTPTLYWTYGDNSWASVGVSGTTGRATLALALRVARAVHVGTSTPVTMPFQVGTLPAPLEPVALMPLSGTGEIAQSTVLYGTSFNPRHGLYLTVSRMSAALVKRLDQKGAPKTTDSVERVLADGTTLRLTVQPDHVKDISEAQLDAIADGIDVTPTLADPSTWLPVLP